MSDTESKDKLGDRLKAAEQEEAGRCADRNLPLLARLDGRAFHTFTGDMQRPYDPIMGKAMREVTSLLVDKFQAKLGYTQSDEITLYWPVPGPGQDYAFGGKFQKLTSTLAGFASSAMNALIGTTSYLNKIWEFPHFDCRVWNADDDADVHYNFLWRHQDGVRNSVSMCAQAEFIHQELQGVSTEAMKEMLRDKANPWENQPDWFKYGTFFRRVKREVFLSMEELARIPREHWPKGPVLRTKVEGVECAALSMANPLYGDNPFP